MSRWRAALPLILLVLAGIVLFASGWLDRLTPQQLVAHQNELHVHIAEHPWMSRLAFIGLLTLATSTGLPGTVVVILAGGFAFGVVDGTLCSSAGLTLGSLILYLASRYAFGAGSRHPPAIVAKLHHGFERHPVSYTLFLRFVPVVPFGAVTVALAWLRCPLWLFVGASWLGGTVALIFETSIGAGLGASMSQSDTFGLGMFMHRNVLLPLGALALLALLPLLIERLTRRYRQADRHID
ncbi:TVP38/TMEM64 family protein [Rhodanobacter panaciterrae]|uniref:TVP38/TMEM64 family membrane protein n=1 Tax=Rhodanobacter panaciterrae TaxID=490572 RepID=A0ABQ2ZY68_9GAMM|nr:VTT domain-containing protein [Rhodanobacter panaciterrae]GGY26318.1 TVP38/TMEM64 family protein [Rhodanobacter panaciterrae]